MLIISQPALWWLPFVLVAPLIIWRAWDSWQETRSLLTTSEVRDWILHRGPRKTSSMNRLDFWWKHFIGRP